MNDRDPLAGLLEGTSLVAGASTEPREVGLGDEPAYRELSDWVSLKVLEAIREGSLKSGERLVEDNLAERFSVSRAPIRDAIAKLMVLGVVERRVPRGVFVRPWSDADRAQVLQLLDSLILLSVDLGVGRLTSKDFKALDDVMLEVEQGTADGSLDPARQLELDSEFHMVMARATGNHRLVELMQQLMLPLRLYTHESLEYLESSFWLRLHGSLLDALKRNDADEAMARALHNMRESRRILLEGISE